MRFLFILLLSLTACAAQVADQPRAVSTSPGLGATPGMPMSVEECDAAGGRVVGDIGDGRVYRSGYLCDNGEAPLGTISYRDGEPIATDGAVCCGTSLSN